MPKNNENDELNLFIDRYIDQVMKGLKLGNIDQKTDKTFREMIRDRTEKRIMRMIIENLSDSEADRVTRELDKTGITEDEEIEILMQAINTIPDFPDKLKDTLRELYQELVEDADELRKNN